MHHTRSSNVYHDRPFSDFQEITHTLYCNRSHIQAAHPPIRDHTQHGNYSNESNAIVSREIIMMIYDVMIKVQWKKTDATETHREEWTGE